MKLKKNKLIKLQILKIYYKKKSANLGNNLNQVKIHFNKISNIIYKYHITGRKILFLGFPNHFIQTIENTRHMLIPEFMWFNGMLSNRTTEKNINLNVFKLITKLKKKVDLVVIANFNEKKTAIKESYIARIPVITVNKKLNISNHKTTYSTIANYNLINEKSEYNNIFFSIIKTSLNKAKKIKIYKNLKKLKENYEKNRPYNYKKFRRK